MPHMHHRKTHSGRWAEFWEKIEPLGVPQDSREAKVWAARYNSDKATLLLNVLDRLYELKLPLEAISLITDTVQLSFEMGQEFDGRID